MEQELRFLQYRLEVAREMPDGPYKAALVDAIQRRMQALQRQNRGR